MDAPALVLLAAGASERLGAPKALVRLGDDGDPGEHTPLARLLSAGAALGADVRALVVTGAHHAALTAALAERAEVELLHHRAWARGRTGSVLAARRARPGRDLCLAPVDVPLVPAGVFAALARAWRDAGAPAEGWLAPAVRVGGRLRHGHPVVVGRGLLGRLTEDAPDRPLRALRQQARPLLEVEVTSPAVLDDLDRPADLARLRALLAAGER